MFTKPNTYTESIQVDAARDFQREGKRYVVDIDLSKFFDRVNHDLLIAQIKGRIKDRRIWRLVDLYLKSGVMVEKTTKLTPFRG